MENRPFLLVFGVATFGPRRSVIYLGQFRFPNVAAHGDRSEGRGQAPTPEGVFSLLTSPNLPRQSPAAPRSGVRGDNGCIGPP